MMPADIPEFVIEDSFAIRGRGTVFTGNCPADWRNRSNAVGATVLVDGKPRIIKALESHAKLVGPNVGEPIGLLFEEDAK